MNLGHYDLVLSASNWLDRSCSGLYLSGLPVSLSISYPVDNSCSWLSATPLDVRCCVTGALNPAAFGLFLEHVIATKHLDENILRI
jgi:hypothetical protein